MHKRKPIPKSIEKQVLFASRRRCCLCFFLNNLDGVRKGQIAHLNHNHSDSRFENLVWLCLEHHDEYDSKTSQSKGLTLEETREYRDRLYATNADKQQMLTNTPPEELTEKKLQKPLSEYDKLREMFPRELSFTTNKWRYPLWQVANTPDFFAYKSANKADGVCLIERIDLPDGRIVMVCIQTAGNPGASITNCVEAICFQVCERFEIPANRLIWLQHYDFDEDQTWNMVTFESMPPNTPFTNPTWTEMTPQMWDSLRLKPKKKLSSSDGHFHSKIMKRFRWPIKLL